MSLPRVLEPEVMDTEEEARDYDAMDHGAVNCLFVENLLRFGLDCGDRDNNEPLGVVDLGCGTAQLPIILCQQAPDVCVMAVDLATRMLDLARYNIEAAGLNDRIQLAQIDAKHCEFEDELFDAAISNSIVHHIPEPRTVLGEAVRITKPGGLLYFRDLMRPDDQTMLDQLVQQYAGDETEHARQMFRDSLHAALSVDEMRQLVGDLGFAADTVQATSDRHWTWAARKPTP